MHLGSLKLAFLAVGLTASGTALAQTAECQRYRTELASLGRNTGGAAQQQRVEIARLSGYYQSIGCERGQFLFFGSAPPAECGAIAQRINMMHGNYARLASDASAYGSDARRRQLVVAIQQSCNPQRQAAARREAEERRSRVADEDVSPRRLGGGRLVCVRACDGSFFPLHNLPESGKSDADEMCQALCPGAETAAYSMPRGGEADLNQAVSLKGKRYTKLAGAFKYQTSYDASCSCRKEGQSWAETLQKAETMIERSRGDIIVTAKKAEELSRPKLARKGNAGSTQATGPTFDVETTGSITPAKQATSEAAASLTASPKSSESVGAGEPEKAVNATDEPMGDETTEGEAKRSVRVVGPAFISLPQAASE